MPWLQKKRHRKLEKFQAQGLLRLYAEYLDNNKRRNADDSLSDKFKSGMEVPVEL